MIPLGKILLCFLVIILAAHYIGLVFDFYIIYRWLDIPMHIAGGAWIALLVVYLFEKRGGEVDGALGTGGKRMLLILGLVAFVGVVWEFYEYLADVLILKKYAIGGQQPAQTFDTLKDLFDDIAGGFLASLFERYFGRG